LVWLTTTFQQSSRHPATSLIQWSQFFCLLFFSTFLLNPLGSVAGFFLFLSLSLSQPIPPNIDQLIAEEQAIVRRGEGAFKYCVDCKSFDFFSSSQFVVLTRMECLQARSPNQRDLTIVIFVKNAC
jgi:hypothetical protein